MIVELLVDYLETLVEQLSSSAKPFGRRSLRNSAADLETAMDAYERRLDVKRTGVLDKVRETCERLYLGGHGEEKRSGEDVHP